MLAWIPRRSGADVLGVQVGHARPHLAIALSHWQHAALRAVPPFQQAWRKAHAGGGRAPPFAMNAPPPATALRPASLRLRSMDRCAPIGRLRSRQGIETMWRKRCVAVRVGCARGTAAASALLQASTMRLIGSDYAPEVYDVFEDNALGIHVLVMQAADAHSELNNVVSRQKKRAGLQVGCSGVVCWLDTCTSKADPAAVFLTASQRTHCASCLAAAPPRAAASELCPRAARPKLSAYRP